MEPEKRKKERKRSPCWFLMSSGVICGVNSPIDMSERDALPSDRPVFLLLFLVEMRRPEDRGWPYITFSLPLMESEPSTFGIIQPLFEKSG